MVKAKKTAKEVLKWKKKKWVPIIAPKILREAGIGESFVMKPETLVGKTIECNLMAITGDMKKQHTSVKFRIESINDAKAKTSIISYKLSPATIKRGVRRKRDRIDIVIQGKTKDGNIVVIKLILITRNNTANSVLTAIRKKTNDLLKGHIPTQSFEELMNDVLSFKIQHELKKQLKIIYPLSICDVKYIGLKNTQRKAINKQVPVLNA